MQWRPSLLSLQHDCAGRSSPSSAAQCYAASWNRPQGKSSRVRGKARSVVARCRIHLRPDGETHAVHRCRVGARCRAREKERTLIAKRTRAAPAQRKARGLPLGNITSLATAAARITASGHAGKRAVTTRFAAPPRRVGSRPSPCRASPRWRRCAERGGIASIVDRHGRPSVGFKSQSAGDQPGGRSSHSATSPFVDSGRPAQGNLGRAFPIARL
jgi:hypothetical protein